MRAATVRSFALSLPEAEERETWETATFRVRNKIYVMFDEKERHLWVKSTHDEQRALIAMNPDAFFVPSYVGSKGWIGVVVSQEPGGGSQLPKGAQVTLHVSNGARLVKPTTTAAQTTTPARRRAGGGAPPGRRP